MNATDALDNITINYKEHLNFALSQIKARSLLGYYNLSLYDGIWRTDSEMTHFVKNILDQKGFKTNFLTDKITGRSFTRIEW